MGTNETHPKNVALAARFSMAYSWKKKGRKCQILQKGGNELQEGILKEIYEDSFKKVNQIF